MQDNNTMSTFCEIISELCYQLHKCADLECVANLLLETLSGKMNYKRVRFWLCNDKGYVGYAHRGMDCMEKSFEGYFVPFEDAEYIDIRKGPQICQYNCLEERCGRLPWWTDLQFDESITEIQDIPIMMDEQSLYPVALIALDKGPNGDRFYPKEIDWLKGLTGIAALAIEKQLQQETLNKYLTALDQLRKASNFKEVVKIILDVIAKVGYKRARFYLCRDKYYEAYDSIGMEGKDFVQKFRIPYQSADYINLKQMDIKPISVVELREQTNALGERYCDTDWWQAIKYDTVDYTITVPLIIEREREKRVLSAISVDKGRKETPFTPDELQWLNIITRHAASIIENFIRLLDLEAILHSAGNLILTITPDYQIQQWYSGASNTLGYSRDDVIHTDIRNLCYNKESKSLLEQEISNVVSNESPRYLPSIQMRHKDGHLIYILLSLSPMREVKVIGEDETFQTEISVIGKDVTSQKELEERQLEFLANVVHDLKSPLTPIMTNMQSLLLYRSDLKPDERGLLESLVRNAGELDRQINDIVYLHKMESEKTFLQFQSLSVKDLVDEVVETFQARASVKQICLKVDFFEEDLTVEGDLKALKQAIGNLVDNAIKYNRENGEVVISSFKYIHETSEEMVCIKIEDTGIGIPQDELQKIFDSYYRADSARSISGSGLGLSIASHIVKQHVGWIIPISSPQGSTFEMYLPLKHPSET